MPSNNRESIFKTNQNFNTNDGGKSGSFFFFTQDKAFLVKTMTNREVGIYLRMMGKLKKHFEKRKTLIAKVYGIYKI